MNSNFIVYCDHKPLVNLKAFKNILSKRRRWIEYLEEMNEKIDHLPAFKNIAVDYLSRNLQVSMETPEFFSYFKCYLAE